MFSNPNSTAWRRWRSPYRADRAAHDGAQVVPAIESELHLGEVPVGVLGQVRSSVRRGLHCGHERHLVLRAAPGLAAAALPTQLGIVDFDPAGELSISLDQSHRLHQLVLDELGGAVAHPNLTLEPSAETLFFDSVRSYIARNRRVSGSLVEPNSVSLLNIDRKE